MSDELTGDTAAFFDLDRTFIGENTALLYALYEYRRGELPLWRLLQASAWMGLYHLSLVDMERAFERAVSHYRGEPVEDVLELTAAFFEEHVIPNVQPGAEATLQHHRRDGRPVVLLTASSPYLSELVADHWELDDWIANRFPADDDGYLKGTYERPFCYGEGKVQRARRWADSHGIDLDGSYFYTDSYSDLPMLERVGNPRVVNPDPRLKRAAQKRDWPIEDWSTPES